MSYDVERKAAEATETLQQARRDLAQTQKDEAKYLADRESKAQALLAGITKRIGSATALLSSVTDKLKLKAGELSERLQEFARGLVSVLDRAKKAAEKTENALEGARKTLGIYTTLLEQVRGKIQEVSDWEKEVEERERTAAALEEKAQSELAEALQIADWHNSGDRYTISKKNHASKITPRRTVQRNGNTRNRSGGDKNGRRR